MGDAAKAMHKPFGQVSKAMGLGDYTESSLFTGAGTPWGAMQTGRPETPNFEAYDSDLSRWKPDMSSVIREGERSNALAGGAASRQLQANLSRGLRGSRTADSARREQDIAARTDFNNRKVVADAEMESLNMAMRQMDAYNRAIQMRNQLKADKYNADAAAFNNEQAQRGQFVNTGLGVLGTIAGAALSGGLGGALGGAAASAAGGALNAFDGIGDGIAAPVGPSYTDGLGLLGKNDLNLLDPNLAQAGADPWSGLFNNDADLYNMGRSRMRSPYYRG